MKTAHPVLERQAFLTKCKTSYSHESRSQNEKTQGSKTYNKLPIGKQHAGNQSEKDTSYRGEKGEKGDETGREKRVN